MKVKEYKPSVSFPELLFLLLVGLKLSGLSDISWWVVFSPIIGLLVAMVLGIIVVFTWESIQNRKG
jgi:phosphate/sulfate permease